MFYSRVMLSEVARRTGGGERAGGSRLSAFADGCDAFGLSILVALAATLVLAAGTLALGGHVSAWHWLAALVLGDATFVREIARAARESGRAQLRVGRRAALAVGWIIAIALVLLVVGRVYDMSFDGQNYHLEGVLSLARGWNPFWTWNVPGSEPGMDTTSVTHYPKGAWIVAAAIYRATGHIETAKAINLLLLLATGALALGTTASLFPRRPATAIGLALLATANPVALAQVFSFYVDGALASTVTALFLVLLRARQRVNRATYAALASLILIAVNLKFTGVIFAPLIVLAFLTVLPRGKRALLAAVAAGAFGVAVLLVGFQPYVANAVAKRNPFYPVSTSATLTEQAHPDFLAQDRVHKLLISLFARGSNASNRMPRLKVPFTLHEDEIRPYTKLDPRFAGLGPFFGGCLLLSIALALAAARVNRRAAAAAATVASIALLSALAISDPWWARFVPQLWLIPVALCAPALASEMPGWLRGAGIATACLLLLNALFIGAATGVTLLRRNALLGRQLVFLRDAARAAPLSVTRTGTCRSLDVRLSEAGVPFTRGPNLACARPIAIDPSCDSFLLCLSGAARDAYPELFKQPPDRAIAGAATAVP